MKNRIRVIRILAFLVFLGGIFGCGIMAYILIQGGIYADEHQTSGYTTNAEFLYIGLSILASIIGGAVSIVLLGSQKRVESIGQLWNDKKKELPRAIGLALLFLVIVFSQSIIAIILFIVLMWNKEIPLLKQWRAKRKKRGISE